MTVSLIVSTYNWPRALELCLESVMHQRVMPTEIVIADDGSGPETRRVVEHFAKHSPVPLLHIWHEDNGFRLAAIRNKAIAASSGEYIIQIDGDIILHRDFVGDHLSFARKGSFVSGARGIITEELTPKIISGEIKTLTPLSKGIGNRNNVMRIPILQKVYPLLRFKRWGRGCNMAFWRDDFAKVNGYDENFVGWGAEDSELLIRMENIGCSLRLLRFGGIQYHIFHHQAEKNNYGNNRRLFDSSKEDKAIRCERGLDQYTTQQPAFYPTVQPL